jgi:hypothetical protein
LRHPHKPTSRESIERTLAEAAEAGNGSAAASDDDLASILNSLQVLAEAVMQLTDSNFALGLM